MCRPRVPGTGAGSHRFDLPEVTFDRPAIAAHQASPQHAAMRDTLRQLLSPLSLAGLATMAAVGLSVHAGAPPHRGTAWFLFAAFVAGFALMQVIDARRPWLQHAILVLMPAAGLLLVWLDPYTGTAPVLLVVWTALAAAAWPGRAAVVAVLLADLCFYLVLRDAGKSQPGLTVVVYGGFQLFAGLCLHYALSAERTRDRLAQVNGELLATRALLADAARHAERLRVARDLHDVAGHRLTALRLHLRALAADPAKAMRSDLATAEALSADLMGDIRAVVQSLRDAPGLDLATALRALAAPLPRPRLVLDLGDDVQVDDPATAEALLRVVQEALTNSARHGDATTLHVRLAREGDRLRLAIEDDGRVRGAIREGNGLAGMRERVAALHGACTIATSPAGALRIDVAVPA